MNNINQQKIDKIMKILENKYQVTERTTLNKMRENPDAFKILVACLLSLRARDENTEKVSKALFKVASTSQDILSIPIKKLEKIIFSSGHYHKKAQALKSVSKEILERFQGEVPKTREELLSIKYIGPKTANIVLNFAFGECVIPVDTHCHRVPNRLGLIKTKTPEQSDIKLNKLVPDKYKCEFNALFVLFGREICTPISPWCSICPLSSLCPRIGVPRTR